MTTRDVRRALELCPWVNFISAVVSGAARGADTEGEHWAAERDVEVLRFEPNWKEYGRRAGPLRNREMAESAEGLVAVWDGKSPGTKNMIETATKLGLRTFVYRVDTGAQVDFPATGPIAELWAAAEERAGIMEDGAGLPRHEAERRAGRLQRR